MSICSLEAIELVPAKDGLTINLLGSEAEQDELWRVYDSSFQPLWGLPKTITKHRCLYYNLYQ